MYKHAYKKQAKEKTHTMKTRKINCCFRRDHWSNSIKQYFLRFLFQDIFSFRARNIPEHSDYPFFQIYSQGLF